MYKLGVLMSVYGAENPVLFIRAVRSVLNQQLTIPATIRVYLGVDGPVPALLEEAIRSTESLFHRVLWFGENRGLAHVLNDLICSREDEDFFFRMDTDDESHSLRFDRQIRYLLEHPDIDILGTDLLEVEEPSGRERIVHFADGPEHARRSIRSRVPVAHPSVCFRARVFESVPAYPEVRIDYQKER